MSSTPSAHFDPGYRPPDSLNAFAQAAALKRTTTRNGGRYNDWRTLVGHCEGPAQQCGPGVAWWQGQAGAPPGPGNTRGTAAVGEDGLSGAGPRRPGSQIGSRALVRIRAWA